MANISQRSFAAGEVAPEFYARTDLARYLIALRTCRNMMVKRAGGLLKRPGTKFVAQCKVASTEPPVEPCVESPLEEETFNDYADAAALEAVWISLPAPGSGFGVLDPFPPLAGFPTSPDNSATISNLVSSPGDAPTTFGQAEVYRTHTYTGLTPGTTYRIRWLFNVETARHGEIGHFPAPHTMTFGGEATGGDRTLYTFNWLYTYGLEDPGFPADTTVIELPGYETEGITIAPPGFVGDQRPSWAGWVELSTLGVADVSGEILFKFGIYDARNAFCEMGAESVRLVSFCPTEAELPPSTIRRYLRIRATETHATPFGANDEIMAIAEVTARETALGPELAAAATITASYTEGGSSPTNANDGNAATYWFSGVNGTPLGNWLVLDFGTPRDITVVTLQSIAAGGFEPKDLVFEVSDNGLEWDDVGWSYTDIAAWTAGEIRSFTRP